ncbi:BTAD domain-containing putative transcriptional regulator [Kribbella sp. NPDC006257]|uniref:AfsR/SARP family transcriptional regulator n=1 Tax=Kribbella sp. NPDC006257 TaxID=3156738 RepID=UPI0033BC4B76
MDFRLLGPFEVWDEGEKIALPRRQERLLLAVLLLRRGETMTVAELIDLVWPEHPPANARGALQVYFSRLRKALPGVQIVGSSAGYGIEVPPDSVDVELFRADIRAAGKDPAAKSELLRQALERWRGPALADVTTEADRLRLTAGLEEERRTALEDRIEADLEAGREVADELATLVAEDPLRERLVVAWMTALYRAGRKQDALAAYTQLAARLADEHGLDPAPVLRRLHLAILRDDPALQQHRKPAAEETVPRELPVDISLLVGRDDLLADGAKVLTAGDRDQAAVFCLFGAAGVGKSAAATKLAHQVAAEFPDGQLFARLQDVNGEAVPARTLLGRMLRSLGVQPRSVPDETAERAAMFQELTADKAILVLLDDAIDAGIVTALLPTGPATAAIVTSRKQLSGLAAAAHEQVQPLDSATSQDLLTNLIGRHLRDQATLAEITAECVGLPLALRIVGSRLALSGDDALQTLAGALAEDDQRLDSLVAGDLAVRTSLNRSLTLADPVARQLLARLSLVGVTEFSSWVAAPLLDCDEPTGEHTFDRLVELGLVELVSGRRYRMHSLVRSYAGEQLAAAGDPDQPRGRYLDAVHRAVAIADQHLNHGMALALYLQVPEKLELPQVEAAVLKDPGGWLDESWPLVSAASRTAIAAGRVEQAAAFGLHLNGYFMMRGLDEVRIDLLEAIASALAETGPLELYVRIKIAVVPAYHPTAGELVQGGEKWLALAEQAGSLELQAHALFQISTGARHLGELDRDREVCLRALAILEQIDGPRSLRSTIMKNLGQNYDERYEYVESERWYRQAMALSPTGSYGQLMLMKLLSEVLLDQGKLDEAEQILTEALSGLQEMSNLYYAGQTICLLARVAFRRKQFAVGRDLLDKVRPLLPEQTDPQLEISIGYAEIDLAMESGAYGKGRRLRHDLIQLGIEQGDERLQNEMRYWLAADPRDPLNRG